MKVRTTAVKEELTLEQQWDKTFPKSDKVDHRKVTFLTHFGITLAADLYTPKGAYGKMPAIAVCGPFGAVKEQCSGLYAQEMAERGFVTVAFDPSYTGESGGTPRYMNAPDINTEDFMAAVDFLISLPNVDTEKVGIIGICGWGGMALNTAGIDTRIKATAVMTMYDMSRVTANGYFDAQNSKEARTTARMALMEQRNKDFATGSYETTDGLPEVDQLPDDAPDFMKQYVAYYKTERGYHPRSVGGNMGWSASANTALLNTRLLSYADEIDSAVLIVHGEKAHSRYMGETAFAILKGDNKELMIIPGATHCDLYDNYDYIPFDKLQKFFEENLK